MSNITEQTLPFKYKSGSLWARLPILILVLFLLWHIYLLATLYYVKHLDLNNIDSELTAKLISVFGKNYLHDIPEAPYWMIFLQDFTIYGFLISLYLLQCVPEYAKPCIYEFDASSLRITRLGIFGNTKNTTRYGADLFTAAAIPDDKKSDYYVRLICKDGSKIDLVRPSGMSARALLQWLIQNYKIANAP